MKIVREVDELTGREYSLQFVADTFEDQVCLKDIFETAEKHLLVFGKCDSLDEPVQTITTIQARCRLKDS